MVPVYWECQVIFLPLLTRSYSLSLPPPLSLCHCSFKMINQVHQQWFFGQDIYYVLGCSAIMDLKIVVHQVCMYMYACYVLHQPLYTVYTAPATGNVKMKRVCFSSANVGVVFSLGLETRRKSPLVPCSVYSWLFHS